MRSLAIFNKVPKPLISLVAPARLERATYCLEGYFRPTMTVYSNLSTAVRAFPPVFRFSWDYSGIFPKPSQDLTTLSYHFSTDSNINLKCILGGRVAKRFTDTEKWADPWFTSLSPKMRLAWLYLCDRCDGAGVWKVHPQLMSFYLNDTVTVQDLKTLGRRLVWLSDELVWIPGFIPFQYGTLKPTNRAHLGIMKRIVAMAEDLPLDETNRALISSFQVLIEGVNRGSIEGQPTLQVEEEVEVKDNSLKGGVGEKRVSTADLELAYAEYPRKEGKTIGMRKLKAEVRTHAQLESLRQAIFHYRQSCESKNTEARFIKHFSTFVSEWRDWLDPSHGMTQVKQRDALAELEAKMTAYRGAT